MDGNGRYAPWGVRVRATYKPHPNQWPSNEKLAVDAKTFKINAVAYVLRLHIWREVAD